MTFFETWDKTKKPKLRIAMLSFHTCPLATLGGKDTGGMNVYVRDLTRELGRIGVHVDVFTRSQDEHVPHVLHDLGYGNRVVHVPAGPEVPLPKKELATYIPDFVEGVHHFTQIKSLQYDLIHSHYWMSGIAAKDLKARWEIPAIHMFHTLGVMKQRVARVADEVEGEYRLDGEREVLSMADRIVAATQAEMAQLLWLYQADTSKIVIIPPGVDTSHFYPIPEDEAKEFIGIPPCDRMLLYVGRIEPLKGIDTVMEAITLMKLSDLRVCLTVIGGDPRVSLKTENKEMARLHELREDIGLNDFVTFLGKRGQDTLPYYYSAADAVVMPSFYESFGMVALEAMACGTPVVASQVGGLAFLVKDGETGYTVPVDDPQALAVRLTNLLENPELQQDMSRRATKFAQDYAWEVIAEKIVVQYREIIGKSSSDPQMLPVL
jgi:D-inositol-3-phosphate glycosyltransferase